MKPKVYTTFEVAAEAFAKQRQNKNTILSLDFDRLYAEFSNDCKTFEDIAKSQGVTRERVRQLYMKYFSQIIPRRPNGRARRKICTLKRRTLNKQERFFNYPAASALKSAVELLGLGIRVIKIETRIVSIEGKRCYFYVSRKARQVSPVNKKLYWRFPLNPSTLKRSEIIILALLENGNFRFFIVPVRQLPARFFEALRSLYIPQGGFNSKGRGRRSDFSDVLKYENAWYYLGKRESPESPVVNLSISSA